MKQLAFGIFCVAVLFLNGCMGRTGEIGTPVAQMYDQQLNKLTVGQSTPQDLQHIFGDDASLKSSNGNEQTWEVFHGGDVDVGQFLLWGQVAHDKDQALLFHFRNGVLSSWDSKVYPDAPQQ